MIKKTLYKIFTFNGIAIIFGCLGTLASILTIFIERWDSQISLRWLIFVIFLSLLLILILLKLVLDLNLLLKRKSYSIYSIVQFVPDQRLFLVENNDNLGYFAMVSIFFMEENCELEFGRGYVKNIQENFTQIEIIEFNEDFINNHQPEMERIMHNDINALHKLLVKTYVKFAI